MAAHIYGNTFLSSWASGITLTGFCFKRVAILHPVHYQISETDQLPINAPPNLTFDAPPVIHNLLDIVAFPVYHCTSLLTYILVRSCTLRDQQLDVYRRVLQ